MRTESPRAARHLHLSATRPGALEDRQWRRRTAPTGVVESRPTHPMRRKTDHPDAARKERFFDSTIAGLDRLHEGKSIGPLLVAIAVAAALGISGLFGLARILQG